MKIIFWTAILLLSTFDPIQSFAQQIVFEGLPSTRFDVPGTERILSPSDKHELKVVLTKDNGKYYWKSRENREMSYSASGAYHIFTDTKGGGYIKVADINIPNKTSSIETNGTGIKPKYVEHLPLGLGSINYFGDSVVFNP